MIEKPHGGGLKSEHPYVAGFAGIALSFLAWTTTLSAEWTRTGWGLRPGGRR